MYPELLKNSRLLNHAREGRDRLFVDGRRLALTRLRSRRSNFTAMTAQDTEFNLELSRRKLLAAAGIGGGAVVVASLIGTGEAEAAAPSRQSPDPVATPPVAGLHLQFGADASSEMVVSWHTLQPVRNPRVVLGRLDGKLEQTVEAGATSYTDRTSS